MIRNHLPLLYGLFTAITGFGITMIAYRLVGLDRGTAMYLSCLTYAILGYVFCRRVFEKYGRK